MDTEKLRRQLIDRITENYREYRANLLLKDRQELIDGAGRIADTALVFQHMADRSYKDGELEYLLKFQNPLEVVTEHWADYELMPDVLDALIADATDRQDDLTLFPLAADAPAQKPDSLRKFLNVDLETVLPQIMKQKTAFYQTDLNYALDAMREGAASGDPAKQNFVLIFRQSGVECLNERDMFIGGTRSFNTLQFYHTQTREPVLTYSVELTGSGKDGLRGNLYQQDNHRLAEFAGRTASPYADTPEQYIVTLVAIFAKSGGYCARMEHFGSTLMIVMPAAATGVWGTAPAIWASPQNLLSIKAHAAVSCIRPKAPAAKIKT